MNKLGSLFAAFVNKIALSLGKNSINRKPPRLIGLYLVVAEKTRK
jgi:hypothetical protein